MPRIECYVPDILKEKIAQLAEAKSIPVSKYIAQVLENHCNTSHDQTAPASQSVFQKKVMAALFDIYACVYEPSIKDGNYEAVLMRMQEIKKQCEEASQIE